jgi:hypothetical protein
MHHAREVLQQLQAELEELSWAAQNATGVDRRRQNATYRTTRSGRRAGDSDITRGYAAETPSREHPVSIREKRPSETTH